MKIVLEKAEAEKTFPQLTIITANVQATRWLPIQLLNFGN
jgi:hypothetical protein